MSLALSPPNTGVFAFVQGNYVTRVDYDANSNAIYLGWAQPGTLSSESGWRIIQNTYDASNRFVSSGFAQNANASPSCGFAFAWDNRATYTYS